MCGQPKHSSELLIFLFFTRMHHSLCVQSNMNSPSPPFAQAINQLLEKKLSDRQHVPSVTKSIYYVSISNMAVITEQRANRLSYCALFAFEKCLAGISKRSTLFRSHRLHRSSVLLFRHVQRRARCRTAVFCDGLSLIYLFQMAGIILRFKMPIRSTCRHEAQSH